MNNKTKIMWILNIPIWICCIASITVLPFSKVAWIILTAIEWLLVLVITIILILGAIELKKEEKKLNKQIEEADKQFKEWLEKLLKDDEETIELENKEDKE